jgi:broad specificity polyphosphatase/5'/3'-nucleotidase SurE
MPTNTYLNVNAPYPIDPKGIKVVRMAEGRWIEEFVEGQDPRGNKYYWLTGHLQNDEPDAPDTDEYVLHRRGMCRLCHAPSILPIQRCIDHFKHLEYALQVQ